MIKSGKNLDKCILFSIKTNFNKKVQVSGPEYDIPENLHLILYQEILFYFFTAAISSS